MAVIPRIAQLLRAQVQPEADRACGDPAGCFIPPTLSQVSVSSSMGGLRGSSLQGVLGVSICNLQWYGSVVGEADGSGGLNLRASTVLKQGSRKKQMALKDPSKQLT